MSYIQEAFNLICQEKKEPSSYYVCLMENVQFYGGPEEGGWWGTDSILIAYQEFPTEELANEAKEKIEKLAEELNQCERDQHGQLCLNQMEWLESRGLDADYLPENDGPSEYHVYVDTEIPVSSYGSRHYE